MYHFLHLSAVTVIQFSLVHFHLAKIYNTIQEYMQELQVGKGAQKKPEGL